MEKHRKYWTTFLTILVGFTTSFSQYSIQGKFIDSENKYSNIVLEYVPSFRDLNSTHMDNIINSSPIDSMGNFHIQGNDLPFQKGLYRLSLLKKGVGAGISNGKWKNFIHIILDNNSHLQLMDCSDIAINFGDCNITGSKDCLLYTSPSPRDATLSRMPSSA